MERNHCSQAVDLQAVFGPYTAMVDDEMRAALTRSPDYGIYGMMRYFLGLTSEKSRPRAGAGGKRFRPGLCLFIANTYGVVGGALSAAVSIELFHNFSLIHDDIEDKDELRRGRPTVWKLWGINHAINAGDGQLILAHRALVKSSTCDPRITVALLDFLTARYVEVMEGQYLDFELTDAHIGDAQVTRGAYLEMLTKKTAVLVGAATQAAGIVAGVPQQEQDALWRYGLSLGMAYQLYDDAMSVWGETAHTGKEQWGDIKTRKKTLPVFVALEQLSGAARDRLVGLYNAVDPLSTTEMAEIVELFDSVQGYQAVRTLIDRYAREAKDAAMELSCTPKNKEVLAGIVDALIPNVSLRQPQHE